MKTVVAALCALALGCPAALSRAQTPDRSSVPGAASRSVQGPMDALGGILGAETPSQSSAPPLTLDEVERIALERNPQIHVAARRLVMAETHVPVAGSLDDPQAMYRGWGVPLAQPWDYNAAQNMFMVTQSLPGPGKRGLQSKMAQSDVSGAKDELESTRLQVRVAVRKAFYDLLLAQEELHIHDEHLGIARQAIEAARIKYTVGKVPQQDILKAQLAMTQLTEHLIRFERDAEVARARLNTLLGRDPASDVRVRGDFEVQAKLPAAGPLEKMAAAARPDLLQAQVAADRSRQEQALAKKAYVPDFTASAGYMLMPPSNDMRNTYMVEGSMSLPWLNRHRHDAEIAESAAKVTEQDAEVAALRSQAFGQIEEALAEASASQRMARLYNDALRPQAEATLHAAVIAYENNETDLLDLLDSQMTVINVDLGWRQAMGEFSTRMADLEMVTGVAVDAQQSATEEK